MGDKNKTKPTDFVKRVKKKPCGKIKINTVQGPSKQINYLRKQSGFPNACEMEHKRKKHGIGE